MSIVDVDLLALATNPLYFTTLPATNISEPAISLLSFHPSFSESVVFPNATARLVVDLPWQAFHEGGVYDAYTNAMYVSSNFDSLDDNINMTIVYFDNDDNYTVANITSSQFPGLWEANGGTSYYPPGANISEPPTHQLWADQGDFVHYSALLSVEPAANESAPILNNYMGLKNYSSINDIRQHPVTGDVWFTDAAYGYYQNFRPPPQVPQQVYRFSPTTGEIQVVADGFNQPNGLEFSPDLTTLYVTDTGAANFNTNATRPATIYAYTVVNDTQLTSRRTFAYCEIGLPDGIHTDTAGNVWCSCGDGVHIWNSAGVLLGKIFLGETSNNFGFGPELPDGQGAVVWVFSNHRMWEVRGLRTQGREVCKDFFGLETCEIEGASAPAEPSTRKMR